MEIKTRVAAPVPPPLFDITGLTEEEMQVMHDVFGAFLYGGKTHDLYTAVHRALGGPGTKYHVRVRTTGTLELVEKEEG